MDQLLTQFTQFSQDVNDIKKQIMFMNNQMSALTQQAQQQRLIMKEKPKSQNTIKNEVHMQTKQLMNDVSTQVVSKLNGENFIHSNMYRMLTKEEYSNASAVISDSELELKGEQMESELGTVEEQAQKIRNILLNELQQGEVPANCTWLKSFLEVIKSTHAEQNKGLAVYTKSFIRKASETARIIVSELGLSTDQKSIIPTIRPAGDIVYIWDGMVFKLGHDIKLGENQYLYGGNSPVNERSSKILSAYLRGGNAYFSIFHQFDLPVIVPIEVVLEFNGHRLIVMPLLPLEGGRLVYGSDNGGQTIHNDEVYVDQLIQFTARQLHLCGHKLPNGKVLYAAGDVEVYIGSDGRLYMLGFGRALPPEASNLVSELEEVQSAVFFRMLRPELCSHFKHKHIEEPSKFPPLNPDAMSNWGSSSLAIDHTNVENATKYLLEKRITQLAEHLNQATNTTHMSVIFHQWGVPMRHMSLVRSNSNDIIKKNLLREMVQRGAKHLLREELKEANDLRKDINEVVANFLTKLVHQNYEASGFWEIWLPRDISASFGKSALSKEESSTLWQLSKNDVYHILTYVCQATGFDIDQHLIDRSTNVDIVFSKDSIIANRVIWKTMSFVESILLADLRDELIQTTTLTEAKMVLKQIASRLSRSNSDLELAKFCSQLTECDSESIRKMWEEKQGKMWEENQSIREIVGCLLLKVNREDGYNCNDSLLLDVSKNDLEGARILEKLSNQSIVLLASEHNEWSLVDTLVNNQFNINAQNQHDNSALSLAANKAQWDLVSLLIQSNADIKSNDQTSMPPLIAACKQHKWEIVNQLLDAKASINVKSKNGETALGYAMDEKHIHALLTLLQANADVLPQDSEKLKKTLNNSLLCLSKDTDQLTSDTFHQLIEAKADINVSAEDGEPLLITAIRDSDQAFVVALLNSKADVNVQQEDDWTAMHWSAKVGDDEMTKILIQAKADINLTTDSEETPLIIASTEGHDGVVALLIAAKAEMDLRIWQGDTALMRASAGGYMLIVRNLLIAKANINAQNAQMSTSLIKAVDKDHTDVSIFLLDAKANPYFRNKIGNSALLVSAERGNIKILHRLINSGAPIDCKGALGKTGLMFAASNGHSEVVEALLDAKAHINIKAKDETNVLFHAASGGFVSIVDFLLKKKANINTKDTSGYTALIAAACNNHSLVVKKLIETKADITARNDRGNDALEIAMRYDYEPIVTLLQAEKSKLKPKKLSKRIASNTGIIGSLRKKLSNAET